MKTIFTFELFGVPVRIEDGRVICADEFVKMVAETTKNAQSRGPQYGFLDGMKQLHGEDMTDLVVVSAPDEIY
jgi:hypothetical protein